MGVVEHALALAEQALDQIAVAQLLVGDAFHHVGVGGVIGAFEHQRLLQVRRLAALRLVEPVGALDQAVGEVVGELGRLPVGEPVLGDQPREEGAVDPPGDIVPRRDRQEGAGVVVEADRVVEAGRLGGHLAEAAHALGLSWNHQAGPSFRHG